MDQRVLRWFGYVQKMDEYRMAIRAGKGKIDVWLNECCEDGLGRQRDDGGGWATMRE